MIYFEKFSVDIFNQKKKKRWQLDSEKVSLIMYEFTQPLYQKQDVTQGQFLNGEQLVWSCLNFWDEAWWFLSLRVFVPLSSSLLLFPQHFSRYVLRPSSGVCQTWEPSQNFKLRTLLNPQGLSVLIPLAITGYKC